MSNPAIYTFEGKTPRIAASAFIAPTAAIIGDVEIGEESNIWFHCVLRGDTNFIRVGKRCNIQDGSIVHVNAVDFPTILGDDVTVGHAAVVHACTLHDRAFVAIGVPDHEGWQVRVFDDHTGAVLGQGLYVIHQGVARSFFTQDDFDTWDGKAVHLKDGGVLVPKNPN